MTKSKDLPEEAEQEPRTLTPEEDGERALRALEASAAIEEAGEEPDLAAPDNPLRQPGEISSPNNEAPPDES